MSTTDVYPSPPTVCQVCKEHPPLPKTKRVHIMTDARKEALKRCQEARLRKIQEKKNTHSADAPATQL
jgi:hypothetical protein